MHPRTRVRPCTGMCAHAAWDTSVPLVCHVTALFGAANRDRICQTRLNLKTDCELKQW